jgi:hypothetical protein
MLLVATTLLTVFHPGYNFPQMRNRHVYQDAKEAVQDKSKGTPMIIQGKTSKSNNETSAKIDSQEKICTKFKVSRINFYNVSWFLIALCNDVDGLHRFSRQDNLRGRICRNIDIVFS